MAGLKVGEAAGLKVGGACLVGEVVGDGMGASVRLGTGALVGSLVTAMALGRGGQVGRGGHVGRDWGGRVQTGRGG